MPRSSCHCLKHYASFDVRALIKTLKTQRLTLRPLLQTDTGAIFQFYKDQCAEDVSGFTAFKNLEAAGKYVAGLVSMNKTGLSYHWAIETTDQKTLVGFCNVYLPAPHLIGLRCCEIAYGLIKERQKLGYMREALDECLNFIMRHEGFYRVEASVSPTNGPSIRLLEGLGFAKEGLQRKKWLSANKRYDMFAYALLADEFTQRTNVNPV